MTVVDLKDGAAYFRKYAAKVPRVAGIALYSAGLRGVQTLVTQMIPQATPKPEDRGLFKAGWRCEPHRTGEMIDGADIFNVETQALFIEKGVRAENVKIGKLMLRALAEWAKRKGLEGADTPKGAMQVAWAIALRMKEKGIFGGGQGLHLLEKLLTEKMPALYREELAREMAALGKP